MLVETNKLGYKSLTVTNVVVQHYHVKQIIHCYYIFGPEIAVAQQKHILKFCLSILSQVVAKAHGRDNDIDLLRELAKVTTAIETIVDDTPVMEQIAKDF